MPPLFPAPIKEIQERDPSSLELSAWVKVWEEMPKIPAAERTSYRDKASMSLNFKLQAYFILILLTALRGESRYLEVSPSSSILNTFPGSIQPGTAGRALRVSSLLHFIFPGSSRLAFSLLLSILTACLSLAAEDAWVP